MSMFVSLVLSSRQKNGPAVSASADAEVASVE